MRAWRTFKKLNIRGPKTHKAYLLAELFAFIVANAYDLLYFNGFYLRFSRTFDGVTTGILLQCKR